MFETLTEFSEKIIKIQGRIDFLMEQLNQFQGKFPEFMDKFNQNLEIFSQKINRINSVSTIFLLCFFDSETLFEVFDEINLELENFEKLVSSDLITYLSIDTQLNLVRARYMLSDNKINYYDCDGYEQVFFFDFKNKGKLEKIFSAENSDCILQKLYNLNKLMGFNEYFFDPIYHDTPPENTRSCSYVAYGDDQGLRIRILITHFDGTTEDYLLEDYIKDKKGDVNSLLSVVRNRIFTASDRESYNPESDELKKFLDEHARKLQHPHALNNLVLMFSKKLSKFCNQLDKAQANLGSGRSDVLQARSSQVSAVDYLLSTNSSAALLHSKSNEEFVSSKNPLFLFLYFTFLLLTCVVSIPFVLYRNHSQHNCWSLFWYPEKSKHEEPIYRSHFSCF